MSDQLQERAKQAIKKLVEDFRGNYSSYKKLAESDVETKLVEELFITILGWDKKDFFKQENVRRGDKRGRADYTFYIGDKIVFYLEVKKVGISLDKEADRQVISYALSRKVPLAISTNFEQMNIFCVEQENALKNVFRTFKTPEDYGNNFSDLWFLSKESFEKGLLLKKAEEEGRLKRRISIDKQLLDDLMRIRSLIASDIEKKYPTKYTINEKDDIIQRILDRLIFIRRCEDTGINPDNLTLAEIKHISDEKAYLKLKYIFKRYDEVYNSGLFTIGKDNDCDKINIDGDIIQKLVYYLYESKDGEYVYNFDWIDADILGQVYEQYLGKILAQTKSGRAKLHEGQAHRKEQGIYYTPTYIVDYIVKNTVGELLKDKKVDIRKIKILDPACGSGSFLIKAFDYVNAHLSGGEEAKQHKLDSQGSYSVKTDIVKNNIFGVDLDNKAVEITKLNLLLKAAEKNRKLPEELDMHIRHGNSLIDDEDVSKESFQWKGEFEEGSFDVVIGNPPWGADFNYKDADFFASRYSISKKNINSFDLFVRRAILLLKEKGYFGFVIPKNSIKSNDYTLLRKFILENTLIKRLNLFGVFEGVTQEFIVLIFIKDKGSIKNKGKNRILINDQNKLEQERFYQNTNYIFNPNLGELFSIFNKVEQGKALEEIIVIRRGEEISKKGEVFCCYSCNNWFPASKQEKKNCPHCNKELFLKRCNKYNLVKENKDENHTTPIITGEDVSPYKVVIKNYYDISKKGISYKNNDFYSGDRLLMNKIAATFKVGFISEDAFCTQNVYSIKAVKEPQHLKVLLALFNSKLWLFYYEKKFNLGAKITTAISIDNIRQLKFPVLKEISSKTIANLVDRMLLLNKQLQSLGDKKTAQTAKLEEEIKRTDQEIDELVYKLYGITEEEKKIIEGSLK